MTPAGSRLSGVGAAPPQLRGRPARTVWEIMHIVHFFLKAAGAKMTDFCGFGAGKSGPAAKKTRKTDRSVSALRPGRSCATEKDTATEHDKS
ncbi:MAG: hypothetical protein OXF89_16765 [Rhodospirillaceae bacterium]|nr:hypothetical protein [Rhodospirillaceae bacterium]